MKFLAVEKAPLMLRLFGGIRFIYSLRSRLGNGNRLCARAQEIMDQAANAGHEAPPHTRLKPTQHLIVI